LIFRIVAKLFGKKQPDQDYGDDKLNFLLAEAFEEAQEKGGDGF